MFPSEAECVASALVRPVVITEYESQQITHWHAHVVYLLTFAWALFWSQPYEASIVHNCCIEQIRGSQHLAAKQKLPSSVFHRTEVKSQSQLKDLHRPQSVKISDSEHQPCQKLGHTNIFCPVRFCKIQSSSSSHLKISSISGDIGVWM